MARETTNAWNSSRECVHALTVGIHDEARPPHEKRRLLRLGSTLRPPRLSTLRSEQSSPNAGTSHSGRANRIRLKRRQVDHPEQSVPTVRHDDAVLMLRPVGPCFPLFEFEERACP